MPHGGIDAHQRCLRQPFFLQVLQKRLGHGDEPFLRPVVAVEVLIEGKKALQVAPLGIKGGLRLPGDLGNEIDIR